MDLAGFCREVLGEEESQESFDSWLEHAYDKSIRPVDVDLEALEAELRSTGGVEWGHDEWPLASSFLPDDAPSSFGIAWLEE